MSTSKKPVSKFNVRFVANLQWVLNEDGTVLHEHQVDGLVEWIRDGRVTVNVSPGECDSQEMADFFKSVSEAFEGNHQTTYTRQGE